MNSPKSWLELTIRARNIFKDIFVWLKLNGFINNNLKQLNNPQQLITNEQPDISVPKNDSVEKDKNESIVNKSGTTTGIQRSRTKKRLNKKQYEELVKFYTVVSFYPKSKQLNELGRKLNLSLKFIQNWFANRRRRDNFDRTISKRKIVNCKLNKEQKDALNALFIKNPHANIEEMRELADLHNLDYGAVSRWLNIKRSTNERLLTTKFAHASSEESIADENNEEIINQIDDEDVTSNYNVAYHDEISNNGSIKNI